MKMLYVYTAYDLRKVVKWLEGAKKVLDGDSPLKIPGCKAAIDNALKELHKDEGEMMATYED